MLHLLLLSLHSSPPAHLTSQLKDVLDLLLVRDDLFDEAIDDGALLRVVGLDSKVFALLAYLEKVIDVLVVNL